MQNNKKLQKTSTLRKWNWQDTEFAAYCDSLKFNRLRLTKEEERAIINIAKRFII